MARFDPHFVEEERAKLAELPSGHRVSGGQGRVTALTRGPETTHRLNRSATDTLEGASKRPGKR